jgi:hypothetical protein
VGEPVTEEMLAEVLYAAEDAGQNTSRDGRACAFAMEYDVVDLARLLVGELRAARAELKAVRAGVVGLARELVADTTTVDVAHAAGYARAERDVVAWLRATSPKSRHATGHSSLNWAAKDIEQGAHRGAAKEGT